MTPIRVPPSKRLIPSWYPDHNLPAKWKDTYEELISCCYNQTQALDTIGQAYGVSRSTVRYHVIPSHRKNQIKSPRHQWRYQREDPKLRARINGRKVAYTRARRHILDLVESAYRRGAPGEALTLEGLSYCVKEDSGVLFRPRTLQNLIRRHEEKAGTVLMEVAGFDSDRPRYRLRTLQGHKPSH